MHWRSFLANLAARGLHDVCLFVSDNHAGLKADRAALFPAVVGQRCQFHLHQNAGHYVPSRRLKKPVAADIRAVFDTPDEAEAKRLIGRFITT